MNFEEMYTIERTENVELTALCLIASKWTIFVTRQSEDLPYPVNM